MTRPAFGKLMALLPLAIALTQCDQVHAMLKPKPDAPSPYAFDLVLRMSPRAEAALKQPGKHLFVDAWYYGDATPAFHAQADKLNRIFLGDESWTYPGAARRVHLRGAPMDTSKFSEIRGGQPQVLVDATQQEGDPDNLVHCHAYTGSVRMAQQQVQVLNCEFDTEDYWENAAASQGASD